MQVRATRKLHAPVMLAQFSGFATFDQVRVFLEGQDTHDRAETVAGTVVKAYASFVVLQACALLSRLLVVGHVSGEIISQIVHITANRFNTDEAKAPHGGDFGIVHPWGRGIEEE